MAAAKPPPTLILSDHELFCCQGRRRVRNGSHSREAQGRVTKDAGGSPLNRSSDRSSHAAQTTRLRVGGPDVRGPDVGGQM